MILSNGYKKHRGERLVCFHCLLFEGCSVWLRSGCTDIEHLNEKIKKHECSSILMDNAMEYMTIGCQLLARIHYKEVVRNHKVLDRVMIACDVISIDMFITFLPVLFFLLKCPPNMYCATLPLHTT